MLEAELPEEWEGGNLAIFARCPQLLSPQHRGARAPQLQEGVSANPLRRLSPEGPRGMFGGDVIVCGLHTEA